MDGVIVDTEPVHRYAYFKQFEELNIAVTEAMYTSFTGFLLAIHFKIERVVL
jgi:beta-phosphoglucomutase-like phosphatase (HAD superfamily)